MRVPVERLTPSFAYSAPPICMMCGTVDSVSTLFTTVGFAYRPSIAGNGGRIRGMPRSPSSDSSSAVSSPQMYAPAPRCTTMSKSNPEPRMFAAEESLRPRVVDRLRQPFVAERELAAHVDEGHIALDCVRGDRDALDELVRIALERASGP